MRFTDRIVLVVGGNSGIGLASAEAFAAEGAIVRLTGRDQPTIDAAVSGIPGARGFRADMADAAAMDGVFDAIARDDGRIDVLFINAGVGGFAPFRTMTPEAWDHVHAINAKGAAFTVQKGVKLMRRGGSIVVTSSIGAQLAIPGNTAYAASKSALDATMVVAAKELVDDGIRVNIVSPGPIETPLLHRNPNMSDEAAAELRERMIREIPMHRMGRPDEVARAVLFLASDEASFITAANLNVDGGAVELR